MVRERARRARGSPASTQCSGSGYDANNPANERAAPPPPHIAGTATFQNHGSFSLSNHFLGLPGFSTITLEPGSQAVVLALAVGRILTVAVSTWPQLFIETSYEITK